MTAIQGTLTILVNEVQQEEKKAIISGVIQDKKKGIDQVVTVTMFGRAAELATRLEGKLALVSGEITNIDKSLELKGRTICPAAVAGFTHVTMLGRLGKDPDIKDGQYGKIASMFMLSSRGKNAPSSAVSVKAYNKTAEVVENYVEKGHLVMVSGNIELWQSGDKQGWQLRANDVTLTPKSINRSSGSGQSHHAAGSNESLNSTTQSSSDWDEIAF